MLVGLAVLALGVVYLFVRNGNEGPGKPLTETIDRGPITATVTATGTVNPVTTVQVGTYVSGPILAIDVDYNSPVVKGQRVAKIDPGPFQMRVEAAEANVANAQARARKSEADLTLKEKQLRRGADGPARRAPCRARLGLPRAGRQGRGGPRTHGPEGARNVALRRASLPLDERTHHRRAGPLAHLSDGRRGGGGAARRELHRATWRIEQGITIMMVTHEANIAAHAGRVITFRDGEIVSDVRQTPRLVAQEKSA
jgi:hypothetical protein